MYEIDPNRIDLAKEFKANPYGEHSPDLQYLLNLMRRPGDQPYHLLVITEPFRRWTLAVNDPGIRGRPSSPTRCSTASRMPSGRSSSCAGKCSPAPTCRSTEPRAAASTRKKIMTTILAYCDRYGRRRRYHALHGELRGAAEYEAEIVRLTNPEAEPEATPFRVEPVATPVNRNYTARRQALRRGSYGLVEANRAIDQLESWTLRVFVWPTTPGAAAGVAGRLVGAEQRGFGLFLGGGRARGPDRRRQGQRRPAKHRCTAAGAALVPGGRPLRRPERNRHARDPGASGGDVMR